MDKEQPWQYAWTYEELDAHDQWLNAQFEREYRDSFDLRDTYDTLEPQPCSEGDSELSDEEIPF